MTCETAEKLQYYFKSEPTSPAWKRSRYCPTRRAPRQWKYNRFQSCPDSDSTLCTNDIVHKVNTLSKKYMVYSNLTPSSTPHNMVTLDEKENMDPKETLLGPTSSWLPNSNADNDMSDKHSMVLLTYAYDITMAQTVLRYVQNPPRISFWVFAKAAKQTLGWKAWTRAGLSGTMRCWIRMH